MWEIWVFDPNRSTRTRLECYVEADTNSDLEKVKKWTQLLLPNSDIIFVHNTNTIKIGTMS